MIGVAGADGLAVDAVDDDVVALQLLGRVALDDVEDYLLREGVALGGVGLQLLDLALELGGFALLAYHFDDGAAGGHAQLGKEVAYQLHVAVVHAVEADRVGRVDDDDSFYHSVGVMLSGGEAAVYFH